MSAIDHSFVTGNMNPAICPGCKGALVPITWSPKAREVDSGDIAVCFHCLKIVKYKAGVRIPDLSRGGIGKPAPAVVPSNITVEEYAELVMNVEVWDKVLEVMTKSKEIREGIERLKKFAPPPSGSIIEFLLK